MNLIWRKDICSYNLKESDPSFRTAGQVLTQEQESLYYIHRKKGNVGDGCRVNDAATRDICRGM